MVWLKSILSAILLSLGLGDVPEQTPTGERCEPTPIATAAQVGEMLESLGYAPEAEVRSDGTIAGFRTELISWDYSAPIAVQVAENGMSITVTAILAPLGDFQQEADRLVAFLRLNNRTENPYVYGVDENNMLTVQVTIPLAGLTVDSLEEALWNLDGELMTTEDLWFAVCPAPIDDGDGDPTIERDRS